MLQLFYDDFLSFVPLQLPQLLDVTTMEQPQFYDDYVLLSFPLAASSKGIDRHGHAHAKGNEDYENIYNHSAVYN